MDVKIDINAELWDKAKAKLSSSQIASAMRMAINEGLTKGRTEVRKGIQGVYNMRTAVLNDGSSGLKIKKATNGNLTGDISATNKPLSIREAQPKLQADSQQISYSKRGKVKRGRTVKRLTVEVIKGQRKTIRTAFVVKGKKIGESPVFARGKRGKPGFDFGKKRLPIDTISTVSPGTAASNERSVEMYKGEVITYANKRFVHHIERMIRAVDGLQ